MHCGPHIIVRVPIPPAVSFATTLTNRCRNRGSPCGDEREGEIQGKGAMRERLRSQRLQTDRSGQQPWQSEVGCASRASHPRFGTGSSRVVGMGMGAPGGAWSNHHARVAGHSPRLACSRVRASGCLGSRRASQERGRALSGLLWPFIAPVLPDCSRCWLCGIITTWLLMASTQAFLPSNGRDHPHPIRRGWQLWALLLLLSDCANVSHGCEPCLRVFGEVSKERLYFFRLSCKKDIEQLFFPTRSKP